MYSCLETPWVTKPVVLQSIGLQRVGKDVGTKPQELEFYSLVLLNCLYPYILSKYDEVKVLVAQLCLILCDTMDCSMPGFSVHGRKPLKA